MSEQNQKTLETYTAGVQRYIDNTGEVTDGSLKELLDAVLADVPQEAAILEIGSAFGREAQYLMSKGYEPDLTDGAEGFVAYLNEHGMRASVLDVVNQPIQKKYDVILAFAVLLHFTEEDFDRAIANIRNALNESGCFAFSLMRGAGEKWSEDKMGAPRYYRYWQEDDLRARLERLGLNVTDVWDGWERWMYVATEKLDDAKAS